MGGLEANLNSSVIGTNGKATLVSTLRASLRETSMVTIASAVTCCSIVVVGRVDGKLAAKTMLGDKVKRSRLGAKVKEPRGRLELLRR